jgi:hypothetical protein
MSKVSQIVGLYCKKIIVDMWREDQETFKVNGYMVYHSSRKGWVCDCKGFLFGHKCRHIEQVIKEYHLER